MVGGLGAAKGRKGGYPSGPGHGVQHGGLPRPASVGDFNEADEENWNINQMPDYEVQAEFEKMLENMNLTEEKKEPLRMLPINKKRDMLTMNSKSVARTKFDSPADYIQFLSNPELSSSKQQHCIESLRVALTNNSLEWVQDFGNKGLKQVLNVLNECFRK